MGAYRFDVVKLGTDLHKTFSSAVDEAAWESGHGGYTGTIAEKSEVVLRSDKKMTLAEAEAFSETDLDKNDHDKWGPAWAVEIEDLAAAVPSYIRSKSEAMVPTAKINGFYFYGYASS